MANIPLPPTGVVAPAVRPVRPPAAPPAPKPPPDRPYYQQGGGILLNQVRVADKAAGEGTLSIGLAVKEGDGWSGIRWQNVDVDRTGAAKLEDLKPGTYRLLRVYRPSATPIPPRGRWQNNEVTIAVTAGKEAALPALQWMPEAPPARRMTR
jgi:hypothetical protein